MKEVGIRDGEFTIEAPRIVCACAGPGESRGRGWVGSW